MEKIELIDLSG
jgi:hypothetical protein